MTMKKVKPELLHRLFYPQVPAVMSVKLGTRVSAMPVVSYSAVSESPPIVAVACAPGASTCRAALKAKAFSLCILDDRHVGSMERLVAARGYEVEDKLLAAGLRHSKGLVLDVPVVRGADAALECALLSSEGVGDHLLLFGGVRAVSSSDRFSASWNFSRYRPILYTGLKDGMTEYPGAAGRRASHRPTRRPRP